MEYIVLSNVQIQQVPTEEYPNRNLLLAFSYLNRYEASGTWEDLTQTLCLVLPKNVVIRAYQITGEPFAIAPNVRKSYVQLGNKTGANSNIGGFGSPPVFLRGDMVKFNVGYRAQVNGGEVTYMTGTNGLPDLFRGFISLVSPNLPFTLECEDNMWLLKQMPTPAKNWGNISLQKIAETVINDSQNLPIITRYKGYIKLKVSDFSKADLKYNVNNFTTTRGSLASMLARIKSQYRVDSYFRGNELRIGYLHYHPDDAARHTFTFQKNILDNHKLKWRRKDDTVLSMIVRSNYLEKDDSPTLDGHEKTKHGSMEILILNQAGEFFYVTKEKGKEFPTKYLNDIGERFTFEINDNITDPKKLFEIGKPQLQKYYYDGFKGSFTTFCIPYVKHGDTVELINPALPEMGAGVNGQRGVYKVKAVQYFGSVDDGFRQEIFLDYKI